MPARLAETPALGASQAYLREQRGDDTYEIGKRRTSIKILDDALGSARETLRALHRSEEVLDSTRVAQREFGVRWVRRRRQARQPSGATK